MSILAVIPARLQSTRVPEKPLVSLAGVPLVRHTALRVLACPRIDAVLVSADDERIAAAVRDLPLQVVVDVRGYRSGSDRVAAAAKERRADVVVDVQVDEVMVSDAMIDAAIISLEVGAIGTVVAPLAPDDLSNGDVVKVALSADGRRALDFARRVPPSWGAVRRGAHVGIYAYGAAALRRFSELPSALREQRDRLEQLRALDRGWPIGVSAIERAGISVNSPRDVGRAQAALAPRVSTLEDEAPRSCAAATKGH